MQAAIFESQPPVVEEKDTVAASTHGCNSATDPWPVLRKDGTIE
jgi:hypothetical protein